MGPFLFEAIIEGTLTRGTDSVAYLQDYRAQTSINLSQGPAGIFRSLMDRKARKQGQQDRHALFMPRVFDLCGGRPASAILELGCGNGWAMSYRGPIYYGVDKSHEFKAELEERGVTFRAADLSHQRIPFSDSSFHLVVLNHIIEHISNSEQLVGEILRVLKPNGFVYIRTPDIRLQGAAFWNDYTHVKPFTPAGLDHLMRSCGFTKTKMLHSNHSTILLDTLTNGAFRWLLCNRFTSTEIEAVYRAP